MQVEPPTSKLPVTDNGTGRIMLVDDEKILLSLQTEVLEGLGYHVVPLDTSTKALEVFLSDPQSFDVVITDLTMPEMRGDVRARKMLGARSDIRIIVCTGNSEEMGREKELGIGIRRYLTKPFSTQALAESVRQVLQEAG